MDSDDDYFSDDLVLDDKTLAVLDAEESKFKQASNTQTEQNASPPPKRQKTTGWRPQAAGGSVHQADTLDDMDDLPAISIRHDGTYGLRDKQRGVSGVSGSASGSNIVAQAGVRPTTTVPLSRGHVSPVRSASSTVPLRANQVPSRPPSPARGSRVIQSPTLSQDVSCTQPGPTQRVDRNVSSANTFNDNVAQLLQQIEELRKKNEIIHAEMETALAARFAKEGEVTILRKRMEKIAQEHLTQVTKLKSAKDEADAKHVSLQKQYEVDKERLKTELTFKRHEIETSSWRHTVSHSPRNDVSQMMGPFPSQRQKSGQWGSAGPSRPVPETPRRPRFGVISDFDIPRKITAADARELPSGFQTDPPRSQLMMARKGKETASFNALPSSPAIPRASQIVDRFPQPDVFGAQMDDGGPVEPVEDFPHVDHGAEDVQMADEVIPAIAPSSQEKTAALVLPSWNLILHGIIVTHTLQGSTLPTLQLLIGVCPTDSGQARSYCAALMRIFDTLGGIPAHPDTDFDHSVRIICYALCEITQLLAKNTLISPLTALLNLLSNLAYMLPSIHVILMSPCVLDHEPPQLLQVLHHVIKDQLQKLDVTVGNEPPELCSLGKETLSLYEALVWWMHDDLENSLSACPDISSVLTALIHPNRPLWFLTGSMRVFLWLSTRKTLFRLLLTRLPNEPQDHDGELAEFDHHPQVTLTCSLLTDTNRQGPEADELKSYIITFFGMISNAHPDARALLVKSQELIPSIVLCLCHNAAPIWDEDGVVLSDPQAVTRAVRIINHATLLLHHLVIGGDATLDLRERLLHAPAKIYRGLVDAFILTFCRLSYANPPYWLEAKNRDQLAAVADLARALLERVIQGPELDLIWETYQDEGEKDNETAMDVDDEEVEAQRIAIS